MTMTIDDLLDKVDDNIKDKQEYVKTLIRLAYAIGKAEQVIKDIKSMEVNF